MLKTGVLGAGHLGKIHINILNEANFTELTGFYDTNPEIRKEVSSLTGIKAFDNMEELIESCDIIDVVTPTLSHYECAKKALQATKHVFIEKPVTQTIEESKSLIKLAGEAGTKVQVGHVERFNPAFKKALKHLETPLFIEAHRLAQFNPRGTDVSVVLDLMIHDIDIILSVVKSPINNIQASGVSIVSETPDIANARIEFSNGCVANLTASRFSMKKMRKTRFFQKNSYVSVDFLKNNFEVIQMKENTNPDPLIPTIDFGKIGKKQLHILKENAPKENAIREELESFVNAINKNEDPIVDLYSAQQALSIANEISLKISKNTTLNSHL